MRFEIIEQSIPNVKEWFLKEDNSRRFIIQSLEYGEIEYFPTLSHYLIPTIIRNGFEPKYRMYMKRETKPINQVGKLSEGLADQEYSKEMLKDMIDFYFHNEATRNVRYFTNCTYDEFLDMFEQEFTIKHSRFITTGEGKIVAGIIVSKDSGKVWIDNFTVISEFDDNGTGTYLLHQTIQKLITDYPEETIYIYLNRDCKNAVSACEGNGFAPFEFWTDMILDR
jgi:predicted DNA-binding protein